MWLLPVLLLLVIQGHFSICQERTVRGTEGGNLTVNCGYGRGWESYKKWWCRGDDWDSCRIIVKTTGSEKLVKKGRASIQDNHSRHKFTMTLERLQYDDADTYWCGIEKIGNDIGFKFYVAVDPAPDPTDFPKPVGRPTPASWDSSFPLTQGITSNQPVALINPNGRSGALASTVAAKKPPAWIVLVPLFLVTLQWLCRG
ncbi:CMRF35-like molecule 5 isoform X2 [Ailuropoda melanoleuca]|uniref:CMRF35-like molecule 5 n=1 Tax=Ailuropoda melanoleuca TaxID=9646 RepID=G1KZL7_AILME|nr:CMRF35-like molecule 5 isoform X2 [Ailuropoda melanoleuca]